VTLSPQQFPPARLFHGSRHDLDGHTLTPGRRMGATQSDVNKPYGQSAKDWVSATAEEHHAWHLAAYQGHGPGSGRARVHEVEPTPQTQMGVEHDDHPVMERAYKEQWFRKPANHAEWVAPSFRVKDTHYMAPGNQGALIGVDWNDVRGRVKPGGFTYDENLKQPTQLDHAHRKALIEHHDREAMGDPKTGDARKALVASRPRPPVLNPAQQALW